MNRQKIFAAILACLLVVSLSGCGNHAVPADSGTSSQIVSSDIAADTTTSDDSTDEISSKEERSSAGQPAEESEPQKEEKTEGNSAAASKPAKPPKTESASPPASQNQPEKTQAPPTAQKPDDSANQDNETPPPKVPETPKPEKPEESEPAKPAKPKFNINDWITFTKSYAGEVGLALNDEAVECWDNPIAANENSTTLEQSIKSRLNLYARNGDITDVWVWAVEIAPNSYEIYIGYA